MTETETLDAEIAEKVMGIPRDRLTTTPDADGWVRPPHYSTDIAAAWLVHLAICDKLFSTRRTYFQALQAQTALPDDGSLVAWPDVLVVLRDRMPEAICRAALAAVAPPRTSP